MKIFRFWYDKIIKTVSSCLLLLLQKLRHAKNHQMLTFSFHVITLIHYVRIWGGYIRIYGRFANNTKVCLSKICGEGASRIQKLRKHLRGEGRVSQMTTLSSKVSTKGPSGGRNISLKYVHVVYGWPLIARLISDLILVSMIT